MAAGTGKTVSSGDAGLTRFVHSPNDKVMQLDQFKTQLNESLP